MTPQTESLPHAFAQRLAEQLGDEEARALIAALDSPAPTSIRLSRVKPPRLDLERIGARSVPWCPSGYYLPERPMFTGDPLFHTGYYYVQEASSMLLHEAVRQLPRVPLTALDLCAAPGGKSTLLIDSLPSGSILISNEVVGHRANILTENLQKWGYARSIVSSAYPDRWGQLSGAFDLIVVDAPCSGEGMFRKDPAARTEWTERSPIDCAARQRDILTDVWDSLKSGGYLVYSTCTFAREENEDIVAFIIDHLGGEAVDLGLQHEGIVRSTLSPHACYRMMPHRISGEGLFMAMIRKTSGSEVRQRASGAGKRSKPAPNPAPREVLGWLEPADTPWLSRVEGDLVYAYPETLEPMLSLLERHKIRPLSLGIPVAILRGKSASPHPALAYSPHLSRGAFESVEITHSETISFLARETITLPEGLTQGIKLLTHRGIPLGFVKHLGNRCNSLLPAEWRIRQSERVRSGIAPDTTTFTSGSCLTNYLIFD